VTIQEALRKGSIALQNGKEARILLSHYLQKKTTELILIENQEFVDPDGYFQLIERAKNDEPIEYITNEVSFYSKTFFIQKGALIPRPETEILIDRTIKAAKNFKHPKVAEIGVGSGIISIMIALLLEDVTIIATDISQEAINIAKINAKRFGVEDKITFIHTPYLQEVTQTFDIIVSNPPYIADAAPVENNLSYEPDIALFGGSIGDEVLKVVIDTALYNDNCYLCCEMGYDQKEPLKQYMQNSGIKDPLFYKDLSGFDRGFIAKIGDNHRQ